MIVSHMNKLKNLNRKHLAIINLLLFMLLPGFSPGFSDLPDDYFIYPEKYAPPDEYHFLPESNTIMTEGRSIKDYADYQLPNLRTLPAHDLRIVVDNRTGNRELQFSNSIWNAGIGPLEFRGEANSGDDDPEVYQILYQDGEPAEEIPMGNFYFSNSHNHWHWEGFSTYQVWSVQEDGSLDELLIESGKVGYCIRDDSSIARFNLEFDNPNRAQRPAYRVCGTRVQGLSVGWVDTYAYNTPGQALDITGVPEGTYALRSIADPGGEIVEENKNDNETVTYFQLEELRVHIIDKSDLGSSGIVLVPHTHGEDKKIKERTNRDQPR
jgi:hypothetical protein